MIGIIDYGAGNLRNVQKALSFLGEQSVIAGEAEVLDRCERLILPGVGAFPAAMEKLQSRGLHDFIRDYIRTRPMLGICLGMQLLFERSYEFSRCDGLGLIEGEVVRLPERTGYKIPHMGWNALSMRTPCRLLDGVTEGEYVYFVHSYYAAVARAENLAAVTDYGMDVTAVVAAGNVYGTQFHPEKSDKTGLRILKNFCSL